MSCRKDLVAWLHWTFDQHNPEFVRQLEQLANWEVRTMNPSDDGPMPEYTGTIHQRLTRVLEHVDRWMRQSGHTADELNSLHEISEALKVEIAWLKGAKEEM